MNDPVNADVLVDTLNSIAKQAQVASYDMEALADEIHDLVNVLWKYRIKRIFGKQLGVDWVSSIPESWFFMSATPNL